jgi:hypothetical protein
VDVDRLDPVFLQFEDECAAQKAKYEGEMHQAQAVELGSRRLFLDFFQTDKATGSPKGIIALDLRRLKL